MRIKSLIPAFTAGLVLISAALLSGCASMDERPPQASAQDLNKLKSIVVVKPRPSVYSASVAGVMVDGSAGGVGQAAMAGAISGYLSATTQARAGGFNGLVKARFPTLDLSREFVDALKGQLNGPTLVVTEEEGPEALNQVKVSWKTASIDVPPGVLMNYAKGADAILLLGITNGFFAPGPLNAFKRSIRVHVLLIDPKTGALLINREAAMHYRFSDPFSFHTYSGLTEDMDSIVQGLRDGLMEQLPVVKAMIRPVLVDMQAAAR